MPASRKAEKNPNRETYHHGDLRAQLIEATRELVESVGPDQFKVSEACRIAGVSTAAPYKHFSDKDEILIAVALAGMDRQRQQMLDEVAPHPLGSLERIIALGRVYVRFATTEPGVFRLIFGLSKGHEREEALVNLGKATFGIVQQEVARYYGREEVTEPDLRRALLLWSFVHGQSFLQIDGKLANMDLTVDLEVFLREIAVRVLQD